MFFFLSKLQSSNELRIYWLSGIDKKKIINITVSIGLFVVFINIILSAIISPWTSLKGRQILGESKFSLINSLVKENNFNSPLKGLTIYVTKNDKKGNLSGIFIYEENRTITAKTGEVLLSKQQENYLSLNNGIIHELNNNKINIIEFQNTIFDFSKYQLQNVTYPKFSERSSLWLISKLNTDILKKDEVWEELNKRLIKPFFILVLTVLSCFLIYSNSEKINLKKFKIFLYVFSFLLIIFNEIALSQTGGGLYFSIFYLFFILLLFFLFLLVLKFILKSESN